MRIGGTAQEAAIHTAKLRIELSQSRSEQQEYLKNVEIARQLERRVEKKKEKGEHMELKAINGKRRAKIEEEKTGQKRQKRSGQIENVLDQIF